MKNAQLKGQTINYKGKGVFEGGTKKTAKAAQSEEDIFSQASEEEENPEQTMHGDYSSESEEVGSIFGRPCVLCPVKIPLRTKDNYWQLDHSRIDPKVNSHLPMLVKPR